MIKITIYELLGLMKDGKAPKKIKYNGVIAEYDEKLFDYWNENLFIDTGFLFKGIFGNDENHLNDEVEIIEEEKEIEKLNLDTDKLKGKEIVRAIDYLLEGKINELIDVINDMRDKEC